MSISHTRCVQSGTQPTSVQTGADHAALLHDNPPIHGAVIFWQQQKSEKRWTVVRPGTPLDEALTKLLGDVDGFMTANEFYAWRLVKNLRSLRAVYADLDQMTDIDLALDACDTARIPRPSFAVFSGRGLHLYWLLNPAPASALPDWQRLQNRIIDALTPVGADPRCRDCTRVLRVVGTVNSKNGDVVRGMPLTMERWSIRSLLAETTPDPVPKPRRGKIKDINAEAAKRGQIRRYARKGVGSWWYTVYRDILALEANLGLIKHGWRDTVMFLHAVALSWFAQPDAILDELLEVGAHHTDLSGDEIRRLSKTAIDRAQRAARGEPKEFEGAPVDPRYKFRAQTLRDWLAEPLAAMGDAVHDLKALCPPETAKARKHARDAGRYADKNTGDGVRAKNVGKQAKAVGMRAAGLTYAEIAASLEVSYKTVYRWLT